MSQTTTPNRRTRLEQTLRSQFSHPRGLLGSLAGRIMSKRGSNVERNLWLVELLKLEAKHRVLELGPGPGVALAAVSAAVTEGEVVGIDHSATMISQSTSRNRQAIEQGRVRPVQSSALELPHDLGRFDRIYSMNVWQFWPDQEAVIDRLVSDHLQPDGILAVGYQPRGKGATAADTDAARRCINGQLTAAGLIDVQGHILDLSPSPVTAVLGRRPAP